MISQAGIYKIKLYENKDFSFSYNEDGTINNDSISSSGNIIELNTNENYGEYSNGINSASNNAIKNRHLVKFQLNGYNQESLFVMEKIQASIYGWIPLLELNDNQTYLINEPFKIKVNPVDTQTTHTFFIELEPVIATLKKLEKVTV